MNLEQRCQNIELILSDIDGVLTDGGIVWDSQGVETKRFHVRDGLGIKLWQQAGHGFGVITARTSRVVDVRVAELGIKIVRQATADKLAAALAVMTELKLPTGQVCYIGDDLPDLRVAASVGLAVAVADACVEMRAAAHYVTALPGGQGAVRETIEMILRAQQRWDELTAAYRFANAAQGS
jgi:3-deoxy-D-manno-octulosonate 8-phosphate phosphatase (KDO 8-P phosphatase)